MTIETTPGALRVARLSQSNLDAYRALMLEAYAAAPDSFTSTHEERAAEPRSWWLRRLADPSGATITIGAFNGDELVGAVALEFSGNAKTRHKAVLIGMYVKAQVRNQGAGRLLVRTAIEHARARPGLGVITLTVTQGNSHAERLYRAAGFQPFGVEPMAVRCGDGYQPKVHMWLYLNSRSTLAATRA